MRRRSGGKNQKRPYPGISKNPARIRRFYYRHHNGIRCNYIFHSDGKRIDDRIVQILIRIGDEYKDGISNIIRRSPDAGGIDQKIGCLQISSQQPVEDIDYIIRGAYALLAFQSGGVMLHSAGIARDGKAFLFFGHSGSGKTTVSRLSSNDTVLNDDLVLILPTDNGWYVFGTPFWNPTQVKPSPQSAPLARLYRLVQAKKVHIEKITPGEALAELVSSVPVIPEDPLRNRLLMKRLIEIIESLPVQKLHFLPDDSFWKAIFPG